MGYKVLSVRLYFSSLIVTQYEKVENTQCFSDKTQVSFHTLASSQLECYSDNGCEAVYDPYCDDQPPFYHCPKRPKSYILDQKFMAATINPKSCVYEKRGTYKCDYR